MRFRIALSSVISACIFIPVFCGEVLELSDRFLEVYQDGIWFVKFYAPWCGHCKQLEPVWEQVAQSLTTTNVRVGRVDCTKFTNVASHFGVRGFPTLIFIKGTRRFEFRGDRTKQELVDFAKRLQRSPIKIIKNCLDIPKRQDKKRLFFVYFDNDDVKDKSLEPLKAAYNKVADEFQTATRFYTSPANCLNKLGDPMAYTTPAVYVFKDQIQYKFEEPEDNDALNSTLMEWVNRERFPIFNKISSGNFNELLKTKKHIVIGVVEENELGQLSIKYEEFKEMLEAIASNNRNLYHNDFIFGWMGKPDLANSVAMTKLPLPSLIVVNSETYQFYLPTLTEDEKHPTPQSIIYLLDQILIKNATALGGDSYLYRFYRVYYELKTTLAGMWKGNPVLTCVLFGLPLGFLSIICYTSCCGDIFEASEDDEQEAKPETAVEDLKKNE